MFGIFKIYGILRNLFATDQIYKCIWDFCASAVPGWGRCFSCQEYVLQEKLPRIKILSQESLLLYNPPVTNSYIHIWGLTFSKKLFAQHIRSFVISSWSR